MMKNQLAGLMKQAQAMQENMKQAQDAIAAMEVEGEAGGGMVKVVMTGRHDVKRVTIAPTLLSEDKDMLEDLVAAPSPAPRSCGRACLRRPTAAPCCSTRSATCPSTCRPNC